MDLQLLYDADRTAFDLALSANDLAGEDGLRTAVLVSLFSDRRAEPDDALPSNDGDRRGWWADAFAEPAGDRLGSRLWLLERGKLTDAVVSQARRYAEEALAWLVEDGVAERVEVTAERQGNERLALAVAIHRPADPPARYRFDDFWNRR